MQGRWALDSLMRAQLSGLRPRFGPLLALLIKPLKPMKLPNAMFVILQRSREQRVALFWGFHVLSEV